MAPVAKEKIFFGSVTRISDLAERPFATRTLDRHEWGTGDYVVGEVMSPPGPLNRIELPSGRLVEVFQGDLVVGALGRRRATLEAVGSWEMIGADGRMEALTSAGLLGRVESAAVGIPPLMSMTYRGHVLRDDAKLTMPGFAREIDPIPYEVPTVLLIGTSMSSGKTTSGRFIVHQLARAGKRVVAMKLTGAARYRDVLSMGDAGADLILDFVDVGLPSTVCPKAYFRNAATTLLSLAADAKPDVVVIEAGASPVEPYNGDVLLDLLRDHLRCTVLCASDPYAVVGVIQGYGITPDLVTGIATSTSAGVELVQKLTGVKALNLLDRESRPELIGLLSDTLGIEL